MEETLSTIRAVLLDVEELQEKSHAVQNWVRRLNDAVYDADDLFDEFAAHQFPLQQGSGLPRQVIDFFSPLNQVAFRFELDHKEKGMGERVDDITNDISMFNFVPRGTTEMRVGNRGIEIHSFFLPC